jgi:hydrogenase maturation factor
MKNKKIKRYPWKCSICNKVYESLDKPPVFISTTCIGVEVKVCVTCDRRIREGKNFYVT